MFKRIILYIHLAQIAHIFFQLEHFFHLQQNPKSPLAQLSLSALHNLVDILVFRRFIEPSCKVLGFVLNHVYVQKHIEPQFLRGNDKLVYDMLIECIGY